MTGSGVLEVSFESSLISAFCRGDWGAEIILVVLPRTRLAGINSVGRVRIESFRLTGFSLGKSAI